jgi:DNA-binding IclR family transcriptional regulator
VATESDSIERNGSATVGPLDRVLTVLEVLADAAPSISLGEIATRTGFPKPTAHRILQVLIRRGYAEAAGAGAYEPGARILELAGRMRAALDLARRARPALEELRRQTPETIHFAILSGSEAVYVEKLEGSRAYRLTSAVGNRLPLHSTAIGKAILAHLPDGEWLSFVSSGQLVARTPNTITDVDVLARELERVRARGFSIDDEENEESTYCIGAAVFGSTGRVLGGISVSGPRFQFLPDDARALAPALVAAAAGVSRALGAPDDAVEAATRARHNERSNGGRTHDGR